MRSDLLLIACVTACGGSQAKREPRSWTERMQSADLHDRNAHEHDRAAAAAERSLSAAYQCGDPALGDQVTSGGQPLTTWQPCFHIADEVAARHREAAMYER